MIILKRYRVTDVNKFKRFMFLVVLFISLIIFTSFTTLKAYSKDIPQFDYITIQKGDSLWSIASNYAKNQDIREVIYRISEVNKIHNTTIHPGDIIKVPLD